MTREERDRRRFSEAFKKEKVKQIESKQITVIELSRIYEVSRHSIYKWIRKYGLKKREERIVVEKESEGAKLIELQKQLKHREQEIGRQQIHIRYLQEVIDYWSKELGEDLEKKVDGPL